MIHVATLNEVQLCLDGPEMVRIVGMKKAVSAGVQYRVGCEAEGSRPPPTISWFRGETPLDDLVSETVVSN